MKKLVMGFLAVALLAALVTILVLCHLGKEDEKTPEQELIAMAPKERAEELIARARQSLTEAESYTLSVEGTVSLTISSEVQGSRFQSVTRLSGIGTADYARHTRKEVNLAIADEETAYTATEGYRSGSLYLSSNESGSRIRLRSSLSLSDYLSFEAAQLHPSFSPLAAEHYAAVSSTVETDGSFMVSLSSPAASSVSALGALLKAEGALLDAPWQAPTDFSTEIILSRDYIPTSVVITCTFNSPTDSLLSLEIVAACTDVNATLPTESPELNDFYPVSDLRVLYILEDALQSRRSASAGAYIHLLESAITDGADILRRRVTERCSYSETYGRPIFIATADDGRAIREISYRNGSLCTTVNEATGIRYITDGEALAYLAERLDAADYSPARVISLSSEASTHTLRLSAPDLSAYADFIGERSVTASATLTVTIENGKLTQSLYRLEISTQDGASLSILHTELCTYHDTLPE